jgi:hypothetical protein
MVRTTLSVLDSKPIASIWLSFSTVMLPICQATFPLAMAAFPSEQTIAPSARRHGAKVRFQARPSFLHPTLFGQRLHTICTRICKMVHNLKARWCGVAMFAKFGLVLLGGVLFPVMGVFALTPLAWELMGRPNESYPELVFAFAGAPLALVTLVAGALIARGAAGRSQRNLAALRGVGSLGVLGCAWLLWSGFAPWQPASDSFGTTILAAICLGVPLLAIGLTILAVAPAMRAFQKDKPRQRRGA